MKTLIKHTPKKTTIRFLDTICVKDGIATATDMDFALSHPTIASNGLYRPIGFETPLARIENSNIDDFPITMKLEGEPVVQIHNPATLLAQLSLLAPAMPKNDYRYYLKGVYFHDNKMVATNGYILHALTHEQPAPATPQIVHANTINIMLDLLKEARKEATATLSFYENCIIFSVGNYTLTSRYIDGTYPEYERAFSIETAHSMPFNASEFQSIKKDIFTLAKQANTKNFCVKLENKTLSYQGQSFPITSNLTGHFDFNLLLQIPSGELHFDINDNHAPVRITHEIGYSVLMPMRSSGVTKMTNSSTYSIGYYRDDGDFAILATLNNNDEAMNDRDFESLSESLMVQMYDRLHRNGDKETLLIKLERQDCEDYINIE